MATELTPPEMAQETVAELIGVHKYYDSVAALQDVDLRLRPGEVHCLAGENGAGKSTLIKVFTGAEQRDRGSYAVAGQAMPTTVSPALAREAGVGVVYQELSLLPHLTVEDNLLMGRFPSSWGLVRRAERTALARECLDRVGLKDLPPAIPVFELPTASRQLVEIARVLDLNARLVIFDEPTTALSETEADELLRRIMALAEQGIAVLYVTHRIEEMFRIGHRVTVLRDGQLVQERPIGSLTPESLVESMVGRPVDNLYPEARTPGTTPRLYVRQLCVSGFGDPVDLTVYSGEIVGLAGLMGAGRSELVQAIFAADSVRGGEVRVDGTALRLDGPREAAAAGVGLLTEDRKESGLLPHLSIAENIGIANYSSMSRAGYLTPTQVRSKAVSAMAGLGLKYRELSDPATSLSGGNQQKMLLARWLGLNARVLLLDEPTKGVDVGAKADIYQLIAELAEGGMAIVVVSSYLPELLGLCDRIVVLREGRLVADLQAAQTSEAEIARFCSLDGGGNEDEEESRGHQHQ